MTDETPGIEREAVSRWLAAHVAHATPPFELSLVAAGGSNLTYRVTDAAAHQWALRRPPVAAVLATAHDMHREWHIIERLGAATDVPVPAAIAWCDDVAVTGAPFYVMAFVDGLILRDEAAAATLSPSECEVATDSLVDVQLAFHAADLDAIGLGDLAKRRTGYVERQLHRWKTQVERAAVRDLPLLDDLHARLSRTVPPERDDPAIAHGDYRFDNCVLGTDRRITAVLDWELCTIGDPVADFCWSLMYWADPGDPATFLDSSPTLAPGFPRRAEVADRYATRSRRDLDALPWFTAFSFWKMACIVEGAHARRLKGASGGAPQRNVASIAARVDGFLDAAAAAASGVC